MMIRVVAVDFEGGCYLVVAQFEKLMIFFPKDKHTRSCYRSSQQFSNG